MQNKAFDLRRSVLLALAVLLVVPTIAAGSFIRINQLGYLPDDVKVAVFLSHDDVKVAAFQLIDTYTGEVVLNSDAVTQCGSLDTLRTTCRLDFSAFSRPGSYYVKAAGAVSPAFAIGTDVYDGTADFILNYMRQQRCGYNPFMRDSCHTHDAYVRYHPTREGQRIDVRGGWHDAADLLQYTPTSANAIYQMMLAWEQCPQAFGDAFQANGLPGANGIPDIIDEIYWGLDWLDRMNPAPGELYNQIADDRDHISVKLPASDPVDYGWGPNNGRPVYFVDGKPQQRGKYMNATMGAASTAGKFASDFAMGARVLAPFYPDFAAKIAQKAQPAYHLGVDKPGNTQTVSIVSPYIYEEDNWVDDMELAAVELYRSTGNGDYLRQAVEYGRREPITPWMGADSARHYQWYPFMNMGHYRVAVAGDARLRSEMARNLRSGIERVAQRGAGHPFRWGIPGVWCSNNLTTAMLTQCILYRELTGDDTFRTMEAALRDWLLGCNPWGTSMIVELPRGGVYPHQPHSNYVFQRIGNTPGGLVDGPVYATIFGSLKGVNIERNDAQLPGDNYLDIQPGDVVFHDNMHDYSTNEPTMDGSASLTFPLAYYQMQGRQGRVPHTVMSHGGIVRGDTTSRCICLVFTAHDHTDGADTIIATLSQRHVPAAFFFTDDFVQKHGQLVSQLHSQGHYISTHSAAHLLYCDWEKRDSTLVSRSEFEADLRRAFAGLAPFGITPQSAPYFVPPYEWYNAEVASWARSMGLQVINFTPGTLSCLDYTWPGVESESANVYRDNAWLWNKIMECEQSQGLNRHFLMIHMGTDPRRPEKFYNELPRLIDTLESRGYTFVLPQQLLEGVKPE